MRSSWVSKECLGEIPEVPSDLASRCTRLVDADCGGCQKFRPLASRGCDRLEQLQGQAHGIHRGMLRFLISVLSCSADHRCSSEVLRVGSMGFWNGFSQMQDACIPQENAAHHALVRFEVLCPDRLRCWLSLRGDMSPLLGISNSHAPV